MKQPDLGSAAFDIVAREKHVIGNGPRIEPIPNDVLDPQLLAIGTRLRASSGAGPISVLSAHIRIMAKHPQLFRCQMEMGMTLFKGALPKRDRELAVLRIGWLCRAPYEWGEHVDIGRRYDLGAEDIDRITCGSSAVGWSEHEAAVLRGVEELIADQSLSDRTWDELSKDWTEPQLIEYLVVVGQYLGLALLQNSLRVPLASDNPGLSHR